MKCWKKDKVETITENVRLSLSFSFVLFFFAPLDFYYSNKSEVWYDVYNIISGVLLVTFISIFVLMIVLMVSSRFSSRLMEIFRFTFFFLLISFYIQGNYIRIPYGSLNGTPIVWKDYWIEELTSVFAWIGILLLLFVIKAKTSRKMYRLVEKYAEIALIMICGFTLVVEYGLEDGKKQKYDFHSTTRNEWNYSSDKNFNILLMDSLDSRVFTDLIRSDEGFEGVMEELDGFTFYRDTLGCYNLTDYSVPLILTGQLYLGQSTYGEFVNEAYDESRLLNYFNENAWSKNIYTTVTLPQGEVAEKIDNLEKIRLIPIYENKFIYDMYRMVCFRYMPTVLKKYFYDAFFEVGANRRAYSRGTSEDVSAFEWGNVIWNNGYRKDGIEVIDTDCFHFYHLEGIHAPRQYHSDFSFTTDRNEVSIEEGTVLCFEIITRWLNYLKQENLYDNSVIIIMGDHGSVDYDIDGNYAQTPLLLVKGYDERHELMINEMPLSYLDLQEAFMELLRGYNGTDLLHDSIDCRQNIISFETLKNKTDDHIESTGRWRVFFLTYLMNEMGTDSIGGPFYEGITDLPAYGENIIKSTGRKY